ncbi:MFS transporter [Bacillus sp. T33-2]|uniref:MFS transporter n=1 Tax=Bacillus sp. T33-2 TaxID=2054168 RepID=UPI001C60DBBD
MIGPVAAGGIVGVIGGFHTLWIDAASFLATIFIAFTLPKMKAGTSTCQKSGLFNEKSVGFRWLTKDRLNISLSLQAMIGSFGASAVLAVFMFYLLSELYLDAKQSGINFMLIGVRGLIGSIIVVPLERRIWRGVLIPVLLMAGGIGFMLPLVSNFWLAPGIAFGLAMICNSAWNSLASTVRHETVPPELLRRVLAFSRVFTRLGMPLGAFLGTLIMGANPTMVFLLAAAAKGVEVIVALASPIKKL